MKNLFIAIGITILVVSIATFAVSAIDSAGSDYAGIGIPFMVAAVASLVSLVITIFWAIPIHFVLQRKNRFGLGWYVIAAIIASVLFVYVLEPFGHDAHIVLLQQALFCSFVGTLGASAFWHMVVYKKRIKKPSNRASR